ncbi:hypothetical protein Ahy_A04g018469 isoform B [Arachis hypogaea]|uniref:Uncharacterized protein n=1 Tax=Arachis hypogaea TaxID=3818 RepID=A0A445DDS1_ARAHY|nr:hypothetical protein Ahy_A04g018469 isoform A [Arachis hypogaea]RYR61313.1 hypothetical protein Ahy_A04g018469 isoform B [Arachis hypogaea]
MVASAIGNTITEITRLSTLRVFGKKTTIIIDNIKRHLLSIKEMVELEHGDAAAPTPAWLMDIPLADVATDLWDLLENQKQSNKSSSFLSIEKRLQRIVDDLTKQPLLKIDRNMKDWEMEIPIGFKDNKEAIIERMLALTKAKGAVAVVAISGIRGTGKTTLAKFVCDDDEKVKNHFDMVFWIDNIHGESYADYVVQQMVHQLATKKKKVENNGSIENVNLQESIDGNKFLLVLDGLHNENRDEWFKLKEKLKEAASSSSAAVLVTTQNYLLRNAIDGDYYTTPKLSEEDSWTLFKQVVREDPSESNIKNAQKKMLSKCGGVPLGILTMARLWKSRGDITEDSETGDLEELFMQEMQLIYYNELPSWHLKQCFAYLSFIFPCEYPSVEENELTRLWMAEGFLGAVHVDSNSSSSSCSPQPQPEDLAHNCIQELGRRSILSVYTDKRDNMTECYLDNELISGLSRFVAGKDRFCMDDGNADVKETIPRVALTSKNFYVSNGTLSSLIENNKSLRTLLWDGQLSKFPNGVNLRFSACDAIFCAFKSLRVLKLRDLGIKILPVSIGELKSIRYLDLSRNNMKTLPSSIGKLKLLQTLKLSHCLQLRELPNEVKYLVSLRHLEIDECLHLSHLPATLKKLTKLETLSNFVVSTLNNHKRILGFKELVNLNNLSGQLEISHLERLKFVDGHHDAAAYLKEKQQLKRLILNWNHDNDHEDNKRDDERSLEQLEPHPNLQQLHIVGYSGVKYSSWLSSLNNLVDLSLNNCSKCESLPLEQFPKLKYLHLRRLDSLKYVIDQDDRCSWLEPEHLQSLSITDCPNLMSWWKGNTHNKALLFGTIKEMEIKYCPKLNSLPLFPNLEESLELEGSSVKPLLDTINYSGMASNSSSDWPLSRVKYLRIKNVEQHSLLPEDWLRNFVSLKYIRISERMSLIKGFKHLHSLSIMTIENCTLVDLSRDEWEGLQSLELLLLYQLAKLESLPKGIKHLTSLTYLDIETCPELKTLTEEIGHLKSLKTLCIIDCHKEPVMIGQRLSTSNISSWSVPLKPTTNDINQVQIGLAQSLEPWFFNYINFRPSFEEACFMELVMVHS